MNHPSLTALLFGLVGLAACSTPEGETTPILERPVVGAVTCRVSRDLLDHSPRNWDPGHALGVTSGGVAFLARAEASPPNPWDYAERTFQVSSFAADGTFGPPLGTYAAKTGPAALAPRGDGLALVWLDGSRFRFGALDAAGRLAQAPTGPGLCDADAQSRPRLAASPAGGFGLVFTDAAAAGRRVRFLGLDADGAPLAEPRTIFEETSWADPAPSVAATPTGYAILYSATSGRRGHVYFTRVDANGKEEVAPVRLSVTDEDGYVAGGAIGFAQATTTLLAVKDGFVAAWPEAHESDSGASSAIRVVRLDSSGVAQGAPVELRKRAADVDEVEPMLLAFGDSVAVLWGRGTHIYMCGGCVPDTSLELVLLDPQTLDPRSTTAKVAFTSPGGLLRRQAAVQGKTVLTTFAITFHVSASPGSAVFTCE